MATKDKDTKKAQPAAAPKAAPAAPKATAPTPAAAAAASAPQEAATPAELVRRHRRKMIGRVTSDKMDKTVTVEVIRNSRDPVYKKYVRERARYKAHDGANQYKVGDRVEIQEHRPMSRGKRWLVTRLLARPVEE
jgi:small subunit ribosomal protein S17